MVFVLTLFLSVLLLCLIEKILVLLQSLLQTIIDLLSLSIKLLIILIEFKSLSVRKFMTFLAKSKPIDNGRLVDTSENNVTNLFHCEHSGLFEALRVKVLLVVGIQTFKFRENWYV